MNQPIKLRSSIYPSPLQLSTKYGDCIANFTNERAYIPLDLVHFFPESESQRLQSNSRLNKNTQYNHEKQSSVCKGFLLSGPRERVAFKGEEVRAALVTCGGLCPGLNDVIRSIVHCLWDRYGVREIIGFRYGYYGLGKQGYKSHSPISLNPKIVQNIHHLGGSFLGSSRGSPSLVEQINTLEKLKINQLYCIGGDGTMRGAKALAEGLKERGIDLHVIGVPKTIDNDLPFVEKTFGFETAVAKAVEAVRAAKIEASSGLRGVGLVKLMGRHAGFIAAHAAIASREADLVLVPELPFQYGKIDRGTDGILPYLQKVLEDKGEAVIIVAEGVGQGQSYQPSLSRLETKDASGNQKLGDVGLMLKDLLIKSFNESKQSINLKYIDPSYMIRATTVSSADAHFAAQLAEDAVHAAMAGFSETLIGSWGGVGTLVPFTMLESSKQLNLDQQIWRQALEATGQPSILN